jgi:phospholipid/cholesterol/gamma-HCH transport system substrate-binding protein
MDIVAPKIEQFIAENRDGLKESVAQLESVTTALNQQRPDLEQLLHVAPNALANFYNIYQPAQGTLTGALAVTQFANPIQFICGAIQSASQLGAEESAALCAQYLGPVLKTLQFNYPPVGVNPVAGVQAKPEQVDYSQGWLREVLGARVAETTRASAPTNVADGLSGLLGLTSGTGQGGR